MNITFLQDYRGVLTGERYFPKGTVLDLDDKENKVVLKFGDDLKIEFLKSSIAGKVSKD